MSMKIFFLYARPFDNIIKYNKHMDYYLIPDFEKAKVRIDLKRLIDENNPNVINEIYFTLELISHSTVCCPTKYSKIHPQKLEINEPILFDWNYEDLSADSRIALTIWSSAKKHHPKRPLGSTMISIFDENDSLRQGKYHLFIWPNVLPDHETPTTTPGLTNDPNIQTLNFLSDQRQTIINNHIHDQKTQEALYIKLHYTYRLIPAAFLEVQFPKFSSTVLFQDKISKEYEEFLSKSNTQTDFNECFQIYDPDSDMNRNDPLEEIFYYLKRQNEENPEKMLPNKEQMKTIDSLIQKTFKADNLKASQKQLFIKYRYHLSQNKKYLIHFLHSVAWATQEESQAIKMLQLWEKIDWVDALHLLSREFAANSLYNNKKTRSHPAMKIIRDYATEIIASMQDKEIVSILLQLIQTIQYDAIGESLMATYLIERSKSNAQIAIYVYWYLKTESESIQQKEAKNTKNLNHEKIQIYKNVFYAFIKEFEEGKEHQDTWEIIKQQEKFVKYLRDLSKAMKEIKNNTERETQYRKRLQEMNWEEFGIVHFPLNISIKLKQPIVNECSIFSSAMAPFKLAYETTGNGKYIFMYKNGDDLRQDQLILEMFSLMDKLLKGVNQDYKLTPYKALACSKSDGFVEFVPKTRTFQDTDLKEHLQKLIQKRSEVVMENYVFSTAGYCAMTYFFIIGDRHLENLLIDEQGKIFHIDFGFILGRDPKPYPPPVKISRQMIDAMGVLSPEKVQQNNNYQKFKLKTTEAYLYLRKQSRMIYNLTVLMLDSGIKDVHNEGLNKLYDKFSINLNDKEAQKYFLMVLEECKNALFPNITDTIHIWATYFRK